MDGFQQCKEALEVDKLHAGLHGSKNLSASRDCTDKGCMEIWVHFLGQKSRSCMGDEHTGMSHGNKEKKAKD